MMHRKDARLIISSVQVATGLLYFLCFVSTPASMSQEPEDVKPKLNLNIQFEGTRRRFIAILVQK